MISCLCPALSVTNTRSRTHVPTHAHTHTCAQTHRGTHALTHTRTLSHIHTHADFRTHTRMHTHALVHTPTYLHTNTHANKRTHANTHTHTHKHTHITPNTMPVNQIFTSIFSITKFLTSWDNQQTLISCIHNVFAENVAPLIEGPTDMNVTVGETFTTNITVRNRNLLVAATIMVLNLPANATYNPDTGLFTWTPSSMEPVKNFR